MVRGLGTALYRRRDRRYHCGDEIWVWETHDSPYHKYGSCEHSKGGYRMLVSFNKATVNEKN